MKSVAVLPGDGIGPEVIEAVLPVIESMGLPLEFRYGTIGWSAWCTGGDPVPAATWRLLEETDTALLGAITSKPLREAELELAEGLRGTGLRYVSPVVQLRQRLGLFANVRPVTDLVAGRFDFVVIRENTEGLYAGFDFHGVDGPIWDVVGDHPNAARSGSADTSVTLRLQTGYGMDRLLRFAFDYARRYGHRTVSLVDKPNVLRYSSDHLRSRLESIAPEYPEVQTEILNVDAAALWMVRRPERFGVVVAENMFGDILSDLGAGVMGGLGLAPSGNFGDGGSYFEPVHGSAPGMAGAGRANPMALFLTVAQLLRHLELEAPAEQLRDAVRAVCRARTSVTYDLGGTASTTTAAAAVGASIGRPRTRYQASVVAVGDELLAGTVVNTNAAKISEVLGDAGYDVRTHLTVADTHADIRDAVGGRLGVDDLVVVVGGLGPTSDDVTRDAVADACGRALEHSEAAWDAIRARFRSLGLDVGEHDRRQALLPQGSDPLPNRNGTAWGARLPAGGTTVVMLPGPPSECLPMLATALTPLPKGSASHVSRWRLLGVVEGDIAGAVDRVLGPLDDGTTVSYRWDYPYVDVTVKQRVEAPLPPALAELLAPHTVSRDGAGAFARLGDLPAFSLADVDVSFGREQLLAGLHRLGVTVTPSADPDAVRLLGSASFAEDGAPYTGTVSLACEVEVAGRRRRYRISAPNRGPEVATFAAEFYAWSLLRALDPTEES